MSHVAPSRAAPLRPPLPAWRQRLAACWPQPLAIDAHERWRIVLGVALGLLVAGALCRGLPHDGAMPWLMAPLGASAVLVFGLPASPLAQPWPVVGGNTLSALLGIACARLAHGHGLPPPLLAALACGLAVALMLAARCLHPPGGAAALLTTLGGPLDWHFALYPVLANSLLLVAAGMAYNTLTRRPYPHVPHPPREAVPGAAEGARRFGDADIDAVLRRYNQVLDVPRDDLQALFEEAELHAYRRRLDALRCEDIMSREPLTVEFGTPLQEAWALLRRRRIKALPVVDRFRRVIGIVTQADFLRAADLDVHDGLDARLRQLIRATPRTHSDKPEVVGQIMTRQVRVASAHRHVAELVPVFASTGHHHIPIIGERERLVGIITQSDLVAALTRVG